MVAKGKAEGDSIVAQALNSKKEIRAEIEEEMAAPTFWDNQESAQKTVSEFSRFKAATKPLGELIAAGDDLEVKESPERLAIRLHSSR